MQRIASMVAVAGLVAAPVFMFGCEKKPADMPEPEAPAAAVEAAPAPEAAPDEAAPAADAPEDMPADDPAPDGVE